MKLQTRSHPGVLDKNHKGTVLFLRCVVYLSLCVAIDLVSNLAPLSSANQAAPVIDRPVLVLQTGHAEGVDALAFSPDGRLLASGSADKTVKLWDTTSKRELRTLAGHKAGVKAVAFRPDGQWLASGAVDGDIKFWDVATGVELRNRSGNGSVSTVVFSPDGRWFATGNMEKVIKLWDLTTEREPLTLSGHSGPITIVAFSADGQWLASGSSDKSLKIWAVATGREVATLTGHTNRITSLAFSADGQWLATGGSDTRIKLWKVGVWREQQLQMGAADQVLAVSFNPDGHTLVTADRNKQIKQHDLQTGRALATIYNAGNEDGPKAIAIAFSNDVRWLASSTGDKRIELRDVATGRDVQTLTTHSYGVYATAFSSQGRWFATAGRDNTVKLWEVATGRALRTLDPKGGFVNFIAFSPDEQLLVSGSLGGNIAVWEVANGQLVRTLHGDNDSVNALGFSPDGRWIVSGGSDHTVKLWNVANGSEVRPASKHDAEVNAVTFSPDGKWIVSGSVDQTIKIWDAATGRELRTLSGHRGEVLSVSFSPDGRWVASGSSDRSVRIWEAATGLLAQTLLDHEAEVKTVAFSKDGRLLASGSKDNRIDLWDVGTGRLVKKLLGHTSEVRALAFSPDGRWLVSGSGDGSTRLWNGTTGEPAATLISIRESVEGFSFPLDVNDWAVVTPDGRFDASPNAMKLMHYVYGLEVITLDQLKDVYYEPGLLAKLIGSSKEPLRSIRPLRDVKLHPEIVKEEVRPGATTLAVTLRNRGGGIGPVRISINGKTVTEDARDDKLKNNPSAETAQVSFDLQGTLINGRDNQITVTVSNYDSETRSGYINGRGTTIGFRPIGEADLQVPKLYAIVGGISDYAGDDLDLRYASKDAEDFATALRLGAERFFGRDHVNITVLSTTGQEGTTWPGKRAFRDAFAEVAKKARPEDVLVIYLAGHGVSAGINTDTYYYLTQEAQSASKESLLNPDVRVATTISSGELTDWLTKTEWVRGEKGLKPLKQVMILDTCAAGTIAGRVALMTKRELSGDQVRAIERLKDRTGFHILMGSAADAVSYEATQYGQGLLTYALLQAMRGAKLREGEFADVSELFQYAADEVPKLARDVGGIQQPLVAAPIGTSFDIGRFTKDEQRQIPLAQAKPLILRPRLIDPEQGFDELGLEASFTKSLKELSYAAVRGPGHRAPPSAYVFVDADDMPNALRPSGTYLVSGNVVRVTLNLIRDGKKIATFQIVGDKADLVDLTDKLNKGIAQVLGNLTTGNTRERSTLALHGVTSGVISFGPAGRQ